jgi:hypothetical protein
VKYVNHPLRKSGIAPTIANSNMCNPVGDPNIKSANKPINPANTIPSESELKIIHPTVTNKRKSGLQ